MNITTNRTTIEILGPSDAQLMVDYHVRNLHRVMVNYIPRNTRSGKLLQRLGFEQEGLAKSYLKIAGRWEDHISTSKINSRYTI